MQSLVSKPTWWRYKYCVCVFFSSSSDAPRQMLRVKPHILKYRNQGPRSFKFRQQLYPRSKKERNSLVLVTPQLSSSFFFLSFFPVTLFLYIMSVLNNLILLFCIFCCRRDIILLYEKYSAETCWSDDPCYPGTI